MPSRFFLSTHRAALVACALIACTDPVASEDDAGTPRHDSGEHEGDGGMDVAPVDAGADAAVAETDAAADGGTCDIDTWARTTLADGDTGYFTAMAIDDEGGVHVAYFEEYFGVDPRLAYRYRSPSGEWAEPSRIFNGYACGMSMAVAPNGDVHVSHDCGAGITYSFLDHETNTWTTEVVGPTDTAIANDIVTRIALGTSGDVHIVGARVFAGSVHQDLLYVHGEPGGPWSTTTVVPAAEGPRLLFFAAGLAVDDAGGVHIAFHDDLDSEARYAYLAPSSDVWSFSTLAEDALDPYILIEPSGREHAVYYDDVNDDLRYATRADVTAAWTSSVVFAEGNTGIAPKLARDSRGGLHVVFTHNSNDIYAYGSVLYGYRAPGATEWSIVTMGSADDRWPSYDDMRVDADGGVHIVYSDITEVAGFPPWVIDLQYAYRAACF